jgi:hypothetical protein
VGFDAREVIDREVAERMSIGSRDDADDCHGHAEQRRSESPARCVDI